MMPKIVDTSWILFAVLGYFAGREWGAPATGALAALFLYLFLPAAAPRADPNQ